MTERATERRAAIALHDACVALNLPCAYTAEGDWLAPGARPAEYHAIDYASVYGGAYVYRAGAGGGQCEPAAPLRDAGFSAGGLGVARWPLRKVIDTLRAMTATAPAARHRAMTSHCYVCGKAMQGAMFHRTIVRDPATGSQSVVKVCYEHRTPDQY